MSGLGFIDQWLLRLDAWWAGMSTTDLVWLAIGFGAQALFSARFLVQWLMSERARRSIVPEVFWYFSFAGGASLLAYAIHRADPVIMFGQAAGLVIYSRNIYFIWREKRLLAAQHDEKAAAQANR